MADWDADSPTLQQNLVRTLRRIRDSAGRRETVRVSDAAAWHREIMDGLEVPRPEYVEKIRGEPGMEAVRVLVGPHEGVPSDRVADALDVCGWVHAEWVRNYPSVNGNGRTARLWANDVAMRYRLPPFVRLRPRPEADAYARAGVEAMNGNWKPTAEVFRVMLGEFL